MDEHKHEEPTKEWQERKKELLKTGTTPPRMVELIKRSTEINIYMVAVERLIEKEQRISGYGGFVAMPDSEGNYHFYDHSKFQPADIENVNREAAKDMEPKIVEAEREIESEVEEAIKK